MAGEEIRQACQHFFWHRRRRSLGDFKPHKLARHIFAQSVEHAFKQAKCLLLILIDRLLLRMSAQPDNLTQSIKRREVFFPMEIELLQQQALFKETPALRINLAGFLCHHRVSLGPNALFDQLWVELVLAHPIVNRRGQA